MRERVMNARELTVNARDEVSLHLQREIMNRAAPTLDGEKLRDAVVGIEYVRRRILTDARANRDHEHVSVGSLVQVVEL